MPKNETKYILQNNLEVNQTGNEIQTVFVILQIKKKISENYTKNVAWKLVPGPFLFLKNSLYKRVGERISLASKELFFKFKKQNSKKLLDIIFQNFKPLEL